MMKYIRQCINVFCSLVISVSSRLVARVSRSAILSFLPNKYTTGITSYLLQGNVQSFIVVLI